ncbi:hypothetical protein F2P56_033619 [Juglans regia]|uniref:Receptor-like serine/threonine-protein kinase n=2 Tax=Juglans regia TaxID=51240 RepID=A0A833TSK1_JUGRE|nr:G-type lectin S-receptor-like serine/threonine-protein kinase At1g34300 [Juglans regia]KAF5444493.1 hypothetical protein F2P56_033619 [Juglans regia]
MTLQIQSLLLLQLLSIVILFLPTILLAVTTISPGSTLYASNTSQIWSSPNNTFSFGFIPLNPPNSPPFLAAIVYSGGIPIWSAGTTPVDSAGYFQFHPTAGDLRLVNGSGHTVWNSSTVGLGVSSASLDDHGNLVLMRNGAFPVWSSFDHPTDTIVPWQNFSTRNSLRNGLFSFGLLEYGNITLKWDDTTVYWSRRLGSSHGENLTSPSLGLLSNGTLSVFDRSIPGMAIIAYSNDHDEGSDMLRFLRLDNDGNLRIYSTARGSGTLTVRWVAVEDQCRVFGYCGDMGICSYNGTNPICTCPSENFEQVDPKDSRKGCQRKLKTEDCPGNLTMLVMEHTLFLTYPPQSIFAVEGSQVFFVGISACNSNCLVNPICDASTILSDGTGMCYYKIPGFITGYYNPALPSTSYVKVCSPAVQNPLPYVQKVVRKGDGRMQARAVSTVLLGSVLGWLALVHTLWWWWSSTKVGRLSGKHALLEYASCAPIQFSYRELQRSTKGFSDKLGSGGFGAVYRGTLANRMVVAVKRLEEMEQQGERQFRMQVATISSTHHLNLVRLIGFCCEGRHRLLVYEFMQNKSLDTCLFQTGDEKLESKLLSWESRFNIALGIARGITYLHDECRDCTVHCNIKPENILLDENYTAKVSDFGLAKLDHHMHRTMTSVIGTRGYLAPEWLANLPLTTKSDVYSFGMVLLEIVSGRRNFEVSAETNWKRFSLWAYEEFEKGNVNGVLDGRLMGNHHHEMEVDMEEVVRAIQVSFLCIQEQPSRRPRIGKVVQMLQGITRIDWPPVH